MVHRRVSAAAAAVLTDIYYDVEAYEKITQYWKVNELRISMIIELDTFAPKTGSIIGGDFNVDIPGTIIVEVLLRRRNTLAIFTARYHNTLYFDITDLTM